MLPPSDEAALRTAVSLILARAEFDDARFTTVLYEMRNQPRGDDVLLHGLIGLVAHLLDCFEVLGADGRELLQHIALEEAAP